MPQTTVRTHSFVKARNQLFIYIEKGETVAESLFRVSQSFSLTDNQMDSLRRMFTQEDLIND
jgi:hypothetical protein